MRAVRKRGRIQAEVPSGVGAVGAVRINHAHVRSRSAINRIAYCQSIDRDAHALDGRIVVQRVIQRPAAEINRAAESAALRIGLVNRDANRILRRTISDQKWCGNRAVPAAARIRRHCHRVRAIRQQRRIKPKIPTHIRASLPAWKSSAGIGPIRAITRISVRDAIHRNRYTRNRRNIVQRPPANQRHAAIGRAGARAVNRHSYRIRRRPTPIRNREASAGRPRLPASRCSGNRNRMRAARKCGRIEGKGPPKVWQPALQRSPG